MSSGGTLSRSSTCSSLLDRAKLHDQRAWNRLVSLYAPLVYRECRVMGVQAQDAPDVVQDVFRKVAGSLSSFRHDRPGDSFRAWLATIAVSSVAFSNDGKMPLAGCAPRDDNAGYAQLWHVPTGTPRGPKLSHGRGGIYAVAISPDGKLMVTRGGLAQGNVLSGEVRFWDISTGNPAGNTLNHDNVVETVVFTKDGKSVLTASWDFTARVWNVQTAEPARRPLRQATAIAAAAYSPNEDKIATRTFGRVVKLWDAATQSTIGRPWQADASVDALAFSPDGKLLVAGCRHEIAPVWDLASGDLLAKAELSEWPVLTVCFTTSGETMAGGYGDGTVRLWEVKRKRDTDATSDC